MSRSCTPFHSTTKLKAYSSTVLPNYFTSVRRTEGFKIYYSSDSLCSCMRMVIKSIFCFSLVWSVKNHLLKQIFFCVFFCLFMFCWNVRKSWRTDRDSKNLVSSWTFKVCSSEVEGFFSLFSPDRNKIGHGHKMAELHPDRKKNEQEEEDDRK